MKNDKMQLLIGLVIGFLIFNFSNRSIIYNWRWLFTKYKGWRKVIIAQARFETGDFKSLNFTKYNNSFGMGCARSREQVSVGCRNNDSGGNYAIYSNAGQSLEDLFLYLDNARFPYQTKTNDMVFFYVDFIKDRNYFEADFNKYLKGVEYYYGRN